MTLVNVGDQLITVDFADVVGSGPRFYGVENSWIDQDQDLYLDRYRRLHGNVVRVQISQEFFEPVNDNDDPDYSEIDFSLTIPMDSQLGKTMTYDSMFKSLAAEFPDMHFQINIWLAARWNAADPDGYLGLGGAFPPRDYAEHREFIRALAHWLVDDCGVSPERLSFTFINEPNLDGFFVGTQADLVRMAEETRATLDQVSPLIQMGGLDEVRGTSWTDGFYPQRPANCCDMWTFHVYERGLPSMWNALQERTEHLSQYGPVWVTEFADTTNGSPDGKMDFSTREAALGFAELLGRLWPTEVDGIVHFRLSDTYTDLFDFGGWVGHGLFADARGTHSDGQAYEPFPAYWVFANMYRELGGSEVISHTAPSGVIVLTTRRVVTDDVQAAFWVVNQESTALLDQSFALYNFPSQDATLLVYDNLVGPTPVLTVSLSGSPLVFTATLPARSSRTFVLSEGQSHGVLDHVLLTPDLATRTAGQAISYTLTAYDVYGNDWDVTAGGAYTITPGAGGSWAGSVYTTEAAGTWTVTGTYGGEVDTATLTVNHALLDYVNLEPAAAVRTAGQSISYALTACDAYSNSWDVTASGGYMIEQGAGGNWMGNVYTTEVTGTWTVTGTWAETDTAIFYHRSDIAFLTVWRPVTQVYLPLILREYVLP